MQLLQANFRKTGTDRCIHDFTQPPIFLPDQKPHVGLKGVKEIMFKVEVRPKKPPVHYLTPR